MPTNYAEWSDAQCIAAIAEMRVKRIRLDIPKVRLVSRINRAGYGISTAEYGAMEDAPLMGAEHIRRGILDAVEKAFDPDIDLTGGDMVQRATELLFQRRTQNSMSYQQMADGISKMGYPITKDQYRSIEQGMTRKVPYPVIVNAAVILQIPAHELIPELDL